jgi:pimeloyl-ACP methyl ester carboxylesterase
MTTDVHQVDDERFFQLVACPTCVGVFGVQTAGGEIPFQVTRRESPVLVITFAGAIDRRKYTLPQFGGARVDEYVSASVVGIADPSLARSPALTAAWYAGHEGFETQQILPGLIRRLVSACGAERVIFVGGSVGGFAALYYSWLLPGSIVIATNPQTDLDRYPLPHTDRYRRYCRRNLDRQTPLSSVITTSVVSCYTERFENTVIYIQNAADPLHVRDHLAPFLAAVDLPDHERLLARLGYWGQAGHAQPPSREWLPWLEAAVASPSSAAKDIQRTRRESVRAAPKPQPPSPDGEDHRLAAAIVDQARALEVETDARSPVRSTS